MQHPEKFADIIDIAAAYDAAMSTAEIDPSSVRWLRHDTLRVCINGRMYQARLTAITEAGLRAAIAKCLDEHCIITAGRHGGDPLKHRKGPGWPGDDAS